MTLGKIDVMRISFITIHPQFVESYLQFGVYASAINNGLLDVDVVNLRDFAVDGPRFSRWSYLWGGDGMLMRPSSSQPRLSELRVTTNGKVVFPSPHGQVWSHKMQRRSLSNCLTI